MFQDMRYVLRMFLKKPGLALIAVVTLAFVIGPNTAMFPSAYAHPELHSKFKALDSPRLSALAHELKAGNQAAVQQFWEEVKGKTPLVETIPDNDHFRRVTFIWRGGAEARSTLLVGQLPPAMFGTPLRRMSNTDVWFLTLRFPADTRVSYGFQRAGQVIADPLNPRKFEHLSLMELPGAPPQAWIQVQPDLSKGTLKQEKLRSAILKEERAVSIYLPAGYNREAGPYGLLVLFDGEEYRSVVPTPTILDNLVGRKKIHPLVVLLVDNVNDVTRDRDLAYSAPFAEFVAKELVSWARQHYRISLDPKQIIAGGSSLGGLCAAYCAFRYPEVFGNVLSQSGAFWRYPGWKRNATDSSRFGWLTRQFLTTRKLPLRFYLEVGQFETGRPVNRLTENRRLRDVLKAKGYSLVYSEYAGGHEYLNWRGSVADGLIALAGR